MSFYGDVRINEIQAASNGSTGVNVTETSSGVSFEFIRKNEDENK